MNKTSLKIATALLSLIFVLSVFPNVRVNAAETSGECGAIGDKVTWTLDSEGLLIISGEGKMADYSTTTGGYSPFFNKRFDIKNVVIDNGVTEIGSYAFMGCELIESVTIPDSVTRIGGSSFMNCDSLQSITFPQSINTIDSLAFETCRNLKSITFPNKDFITIHNDSFFGCYSVESLVVNKEFYNKEIYRHNLISNLDSVDVNFYYNVKFVNEDGTVLQSGNQVGAPVYNGSTPEKIADDQYTYSFSGWSDGSKTYGTNDVLPVLTADTTYTAQYSTTTNQYTVTFKNYDDKVLSSTAYDYDTKAEDIKVPTPSRAADTQYTYTFTGWDKEIADVTGDATYTAQYSSTVNKYTVKFVDDEGNVLQSSDVAYGTSPVYTGATPAKAETATATYSFVAWSDGNTFYDPNNKLPAVTGDATYRALFVETLKPAEEEKQAETETNKPDDIRPASEPITYTIGEVKGDGIN